MIYGKTIGNIILEGLAEFEKVASPDRLSEATRISDGLEKIASVDLGARNEHSLKEVIKTASDCIRGLVGEVHGMKKAAQVEEVVSSMIENGLVGPFSYVEKVAELMRKDDRELSIIKEAVSLTQNFQLFEKQATVQPKTRAKSGMFDGVL